MSTIQNEFLPTDRDRQEPMQLHDRPINLSEPERWATMVGGGFLTLIGLRRGGFGGATLAILGGGLLYCGAKGYCDVYGVLGINTSSRKGQMASVKHGQGIKVEKSITINKLPEELYRFWRDPENLPQIMSHLQSVKVIGGNRTHWIAKAPAGTTVEWDAEIYNEKNEPNEKMIAWRSLQGSEIPNAGSVHFETAPNERGTKVRVVLSYVPPAGKLGALVAKLFGEEPEMQVEEGLRRFKQLMETGETATARTSTAR